MQFHFDISVTFYFVILLSTLQLATIKLKRNFLVSIFSVTNRSLILLFLCLKELGVTLEGHVLSFSATPGDEFLKDPNGRQFSFRSNALREM
jgi:hypothetical protein